VTAPEYTLAAIVATGELERFYSGMSVLVSRAADGEPCAALAAFSGLEVLLDEDLFRRAQEPEATPSLSWGGRETFARSLLELRDTALGLESLSLFACSASVETMSLTPGAVEERLAGVMSTPRFLREARGATLLFV
jgi:peroxiredoxin family protein